MEIGKSIHIGEIKLPEGVEIIGNPNAPVVAVAAPKAAVEETPAEGAATATGDVEMIKEKKDEAAPAGDKKAAAPAKDAKAAPAKAAAPAKDAKAAPAAEKKK
jgi:large subunit ribosomal protein L25